MATKDTSLQRKARLHNNSQQHRTRPIPTGNDMLKDSSWQLQS